MGMKVFSSGVNFRDAVKSDTTAVNCKAIYVGTGGVLVLAQSTTATPVTFKGIAAGSFVPIELKLGRIMAATTAADLVILDW